MKTFRQSAKVKIEKKEGKKGRREVSYIRFVCIYLLELLNLRVCFNEEKAMR